ncbi:MAG: insulinase family protein [Clostridium sp.]|nr:insulinase family protein [Clostridium sp.]
MKLRQLFFCCLLCCMASALAQTAVPSLPQDDSVRLGRLDNGLTYYIRHNKYPERQAEFYIAQRVGSIQEEEEQRGLAHFLEHMCFNGTEHFPGNELIRYLESVGVKFGENLNAYTSVDQTVYNISNVPATRESVLDSCLLILYDWAGALTLDGEEIDKERSVIHEEWRSRSNPVLRMYERALPRLYPDCRYGLRLPIGLMSVVDGFEHQALRDYYEKWYRPDLQAIIVVGDIDVDRMERKIRELFAHLAMPADPAPREYLPVADNPRPIVVSEKDKEQTSSSVTIIHKHEVFPDSLKNTPFYYYHQYLDAMATGILNMRIHEKGLNPDVPFVSASVDEDTYEMSRTKGAFSISIMPKEGQWEAAVDTVVAEVMRACRYGFTQTEYDRMRAELISQVESQYQNRDKRYNASYVNACVEHFLNSEPLVSLDTEYALYTQMAPTVTLDEVNQRMRQLAEPRDTNLVIMSMSPDKDGLPVPTEAELLGWVKAAQQIDLGPYVDNVRNEPLIATLPQPGRIVRTAAGPFGSELLTLSNGVRVYLKPTDYKDNEVRMQAYSPGGAGLYGLDDDVNLKVFDEVIGSSGLGSFTRLELQKALAGVQASVSPGLLARSERLSGTATPKDLKTMFELTYLSFQAPRRDDQTVASTLTALRESMINQEAKPMSAFGDSLMATVYDRHPRAAHLKHQMLDRVSYDRVLQIYADRFADASDFTFILCGNFRTDSIRPLIEQYLATLPALKRREKPADTRQYMHRGTLTNRFERRMETPQAMAVQMWHGPAKSTLRHHVLADMLGQVLDMRYTETIRESIGAAYSVGVSGGVNYNSADKPRYVVQIFAPVKPELCDTAMTVMDRELEAIAERGVEAKYLDKVKEYLLKTIDENRRSNAYWMGCIESEVKRGIDFDTHYKDVVAAVTSADLQKLARRILKDANRLRVIMLPDVSGDGAPAAPQAPEAE